MVNYQNSVIYKLCCKDPNITYIYIGSTTSFRHRKCAHKTKCNNEKDRGYNTPVYQFIRQNGGWMNWDMVEVEKYKATDKSDLHKRERYWLESLGATLNKYIPTRSVKEYRQNNTDKILQRQAEYRQNNKDKILQRQAEYRQNNKDKILQRQAEYYQNNKDKIKQRDANYYQNNKDKIKQRDAEYYQNNKDKILQKKAEYYQNNKDKIRQKVTCECGSVVQKDYLKKHKKTAKHKKLLEEQKTE